MLFGPISLVIGVLLVITWIATGIYAARAAGHAERGVKLLQETVEELRLMRAARHTQPDQPPPPPRSAI